QFRFAVTKCALARAAAQETVCVSQRNRGRAQGPVGGVGGVVADSVARREITQLQDGGLRVGDLSDHALKLRPGYATIQRQARPREIERVAGSECDAGTVRQASALGGDKAADLLEPFL